MFRVGIVGCGLIGTKRARVIKEDPSCCLCCAADVNAVCAAGLIKQYGDRKGMAYGDWKEMLDKEHFDAVVVATPNKYLKKITLWAAQRKINVLCEKPLGKNALEAERMVAVAKENGVVLKTGFNHRHHPAIFKAHQLVEDGAIGETYFARCVYGHGGRPGYEKEWRANKDICGGGEMLDQGVHVVDLFRWFMGDFEEAYGLIPTYYWDMEVEDNAFAFFKTAKGKITSMHTSWTQWKNRFAFEIFGEAGYLIVEGLGGSYGVEKLTVGRRQKAEDEKTEVGCRMSDVRRARARDRGQRTIMLGCWNAGIKNAEVGDRRTKRQRSDVGCQTSEGQEQGTEAGDQPPAHRGLRPGGRSEVRGQEKNELPCYAGGAPDEETIVFDGPDVSWEEEWKEFISAIENKRDPTGNGWDGYQANRMIEAVYASARENRPVKISMIT